MVKMEIAPICEHCELYQNLMCEGNDYFCVKFQRMRYKSEKEVEIEEVLGREIES